jgi:hypothetical protein
MFANDLFKGKAIYKPAPGDASIILESTFDNGLVAAGPAKIQYPNGELYEGRINM